MTVGFLNSRILSTSSATNRLGNLTGASIVSLAPNQNHHPPPLTQSVIYAHQLSSAGATVASLNRIKTDPVDLQRHLSSPTNILPMMLPTILSNHHSPTISLNLTNQQNSLSTATLTSPHQQIAIAAAASPHSFSAANLVGTKSSASTISNLASSAVSICKSDTASPLPVQQFQSTPIPASRKSSALFLLSKDHSPVVSTPAALTLDNSSTASLEHSLSAVIPSSAATSSGTFVLSGTSFANASNISIAPSTPTAQLTNSIMPSVASAFSRASVLSPSATVVGGKVQDYIEMREVIKSMVQEAIVEFEGEEMAFCRSLAASLRTLDRSKKDIAKLELQQVIVRHTNPGYCNNSLANYHFSSTIGSTANLIDEDNGNNLVITPVVRSSPNGGDHLNNGPTNTVSTIIKTMALLNKNSETTSVDNISNKQSTKLDNGQPMVVNLESGGGRSKNGHPNKT